jgi:hypothetical protein
LVASLAAAQAEMVVLFHILVGVKAVAVGVAAVPLRVLSTVNRVGVFPSKHLIQLK